MINKGQSVIDWEYAGLAVSRELTGHQQLLAGSASENRDTPGGIRNVTRLRCCRRQTARYIKANQASLFPRPAYVTDAVDFRHGK